MAPKALKKLLTLPGSSLAPLVWERRFWNRAEIVKDSFWEKVEQNKKQTFHLSYLLALVRKFLGLNTRYLLWIISKVKGF